MGERLSPNYESRESEVNLFEEADFMIFDFDGVLLDSMPRICLATYWLIKDLGRPPELIATVTEQHIRDTYDSPPFEYIKTFGVPVETDDEKRRAKELHFNVNLPKAANELGPDKMFPDVIETVKAMASNGKQLGIISAGPADAINKILLDNNLGNYFAFVIGDQHNKKESIRKKVEGSGMKASRIVYFGDLPSDIRDAKGSGSDIRSVAVARTTAAEVRLKKVDPNYMVTGLTLEDLTRARKFE